VARLSPRGVDWILEFESLSGRRRRQLQKSPTRELIYSGLQACSLRRVVANVHISHPSRRSETPAIRYLLTEGFFAPPLVLGGLRKWLLSRLSIVRVRPGELGFGCEILRFWVSTRPREFIAESLRFSQENSRSLLQWRLS
jgi:hypothetical protein